MCQQGIFVPVFFRIFFRLNLVQVRPDLDVNGFDIRNIGFQFSCGLIFPGILGTGEGDLFLFYGFVICSLGFFQALLCFRCGSVCHGQCLLRGGGLAFCFGSVGADPRLLSVPREDILLLANQLGRTDQLLRRVWIIWLLFCELLLLISCPAYIKALLIQFLFFLVKLRQLRTYSNDLQKRVRLFLPGCFHELRKVQCQLFHKLIQELLAAFFSGRVCNLQVAVLSLALHDKAVVHDDLQPGRDGTVSIGCLRRLVFLPAQRPGDRVQHRSLSLSVLPSDDRQAVRGRFHNCSVDPFDVLNLQSVYFHLVFLLL